MVGTALIEVVSETSQFRPACDEATCCLDLEGHRPVVERDLQFRPNADHLLTTRRAAPANVLR
jgi:hypothetical protein